jgi:hypothetical protein
MEVMGYGAETRLSETTESQLVASLRTSEWKIVRRTIDLVHRLIALPSTNSINLVCESNIAAVYFIRIDSNNWT